MDCLNDNVIKTLEELGYDYDDLKPKIKQYLIDIESSIKNTEELFLNLGEQLKNNKPTLKSVASSVNIQSRQTFYNNPVLKKYTEYRIEEALSLSPLHQLYILNDKISDYKEKLELMVSRDIDTEILRYEVKKLREIIKNREETLQRMEHQASERDSEIKKLRKSLYNDISNEKNKPNNVSSIHSKKK